MGGFGSAGRRLYLGVGGGGWGAPVRSSFVDRPYRGEYSPATLARRALGERMPKSKKVATSAETKTSVSSSKSPQRDSGGTPGRKSSPPGRTTPTAPKAVGAGKAPGQGSKPPVAAAPPPGPSKQPGGVSKQPAGVAKPPVASPKAPVSSPKPPGGSPKPSVASPKPPGRPSVKSVGSPPTTGATGKSNGKSDVKADGKSTVKATAKPALASGAPAGSKGSAPAVLTAGVKGSGTKSASGSGKVSKKSAPESPPMPAVPRKFPKGGPSKADVRKYRARLLELRRGLLSNSRDLASEALKSSGSEFPVDRAADNGSDNYEQDFSLQLLEGEAAQLADIREALLKIDGKVEHPYGVCEACADTDKRLCETCPWIPPSRLDVMPHARLCVQTKEIEERKKQR